MKAPITPTTPTSAPDSTTGAISKIVDRHCNGLKSRWRPTVEELIHNIQEFGPDISIQSTKSYINLSRGSKKFAAIQVLNDNLSVGLKVVRVQLTDPYQKATNWHLNMSHRVTITRADQIDDQLLSNLQMAYEQASKLK